MLRSELVQRLAQAIPGTCAPKTLSFYVLMNAILLFCFIFNVMIPGPLAPLLLGPTSAARERKLSALFDPFDEQACNAHLFMLIFDSALLSLFPEMAVGATDSG